MAGPEQETDSPMDGFSEDQLSAIARVVRDVLSESRQESRSGAEEQAGSQEGREQGKRNGGIAPDRRSRVHGAW